MPCWDTIDLHRDMCQFVMTLTNFSFDKNNQCIQSNDRSTCTYSFFVFVLPQPKS